MRDQATWLFRTLWFLLPLTLGQVASDAVADAGNAVPRTLTVGLWLIWAVVLIASMVPLPHTLTLLRILAPGALPTAVWALLDADVTVLELVALVHTAAVTILALNQLIGDRFVDGGSYGDERRMLLRPPSPLALGVAPLLWVAMTASIVAGPLLLADERWVIGAVLCVVGAVVVAAGARALHQLSRRWIVFVPAGMVFHDLMILTEPVMFRRTAIERLGAAIQGSPARDLSNRAPGLLIECELTDPAPLGLRNPGAGTEAALSDVRRFLFSPTRPGELLDEAERRNIAVD